MTETTAGSDCPQCAMKDKTPVLQVGVPDETLAYRLGREAGFRSALFHAAALVQQAAKDRNRSDVNANRTTAAILDIRIPPS